jgi:predicted DNA-binding protein with PD1-like motif
MESIKLARRSSLLDTINAPPFSPSTLVMMHKPAGFWLSIFIISSTTSLLLTWTRFRKLLFVKDKPTTNTSSSSSSSKPSQGTFHTLRLLPGEEIISSLKQFLTINNITACAITTCVGSLTDTTLRLAMASSGNPGEPYVAKGPHEICSLVGTLSSNGNHIHASVSDGQGQVWGGHLISGIVHTTVEIVLVILHDVKYERIFDNKTGYRELHVV